MTMERLQKVLAHAGIASRRRGEDLIREGRVLVNGEKALLGMKVHVEKDHITVDGRPIKKEKRLYLLLNKPLGYLSTVTDPFRRPTVFDLLPSIEERIYPVGRLDMDSRGLLLLTNDGPLTHGLLHPSFGISKTYQVLLAGSFHEDPTLLISGVPLDDGIAYAAKVSILSKDRERTSLKVTLKQGKKRQIRRMFDYLGYKVLDLKRTSLASLTLEGVEEGCYRFLTNQEVNHLKRCLSKE